MQVQAAAKAVIQDDNGAVLLLQRSMPYYGQTNLVWDLPGGRLDPGESLEQTLRRELKEETGLELQEIGRVFYVKDFIIDSQGIQVVRITFVAKAIGDITLSHEHIDYRWVPRAELPLKDTATHFVEALKANDWIDA